MTAPATPPQQIDMERVVRRAANTAARAGADLAAELAMTQEIADISGARVVELEKQLEERDAELARLRQSTDDLRVQLAERDAAAAAVDEQPQAGPAPTD